MTTEATPGKLRLAKMLCVLWAKARTLMNPWRELREQREENARLVAALTDTFITGLHIGDGTIDLGLKAPAAEIMAGMFLGMFEKHQAADNYLECRFSSKSGEVLVTVVRPNGKTPHQLRREAEYKLAEHMNTHKPEITGIPSGISG